MGHVGFILGSSCRHPGVILSCLGTPELTKAFPEQLPEETLAKDLLLGELLREAIWPYWNDLGSILESSWGHLGAISGHLGPKNLKSAYIKGQLVLCSSALKGLRKPSEA